jgi:hypothetical protein
MTTFQQLAFVIIKTMKSFRVCFSIFCIVLCFRFTNAASNEFGQLGSTFGNELNNIDFASIIGSPLLAVVSAQAIASRTTADFIDQLGFKQDEEGNKYVIMINFVYERLVNGSMDKYTMTLPFLTLLPIPYLEVREFRLEFKSVDALDVLK